MPCAYYRIKISSRLKNAPTTAQAAYISGERIKDELTNRTKNYTSKGGIVYTEIMLPDNAPIEYADRSTLWNSVEKVESKGNAQNARKLEIALPRELPMEANIKMVREYCQDEFVSQGMIVDIAIHDPAPEGNNPHVHVMLTMRAMDEKGKWLPKSHREYVLDSEGNRVRNAKGEWVIVKVDTVDWNNRDNAEKWRHAWEVIQNEYLAEYNSPERISMKSYKRQGIDRIPMVHMGPAVAAMERKGIQTDIGDLNREIRKTNELIEQIRRAIEQIRKWIKDIMDAIREREKEPKEMSLPDILDKAYSDLKKEYGEAYSSLINFYQFTGISESGFKKAVSYLRENGISTYLDLEQRFNKTEERYEPLRKQLSGIEEEQKKANALLKAGRVRADLNPVHKKYSTTFWKAAKEKYYMLHSNDIQKWEAADEYIKKNHPEKLLDLDELSVSVSSLTEKLEEVQSELKPYSRDLINLEEAIRDVRSLMPDLEHKEKGETVYYVGKSLHKRLKEEVERAEKEKTKQHEDIGKDRDDLEI